MSSQKHNSESKRLKWVTWYDMTSFQTGMFVYTSNNYSYIISLIINVNLCESTVLSIQRRIVVVCISGVIIQKSRTLMLLYELCQ